MGRKFKVRYREHINAIRTNKQQNSKYAQHMVETGHAYDTVTELINALPGNSSVNMVQHATIDGAVFCVIRAQQRWKNGVMQPASMKAVTSSTIETVFSVGSVQSAYKRSECRRKFSSEQLRDSSKLEEYSKQAVSLRSREEYKKSACEDLKTLLCAVAQ
jgi:hypothetical protein